MNIDKRLQKLEAQKKPKKFGDMGDFYKMLKKPKHRADFDSWYNRKRKGKPLKG